MLYYYSIQESVRNYAGVAKLADALDLGSSSYECRFKSCHPHHNSLVLWCSWLTCQSVTLEIAGSSPVGTAIFKNAPVVQLDRILDYGSRGWGFESSRACHKIKYIIIRDLAQLGRASGLGPEGHRFESCSPDHYKQV